MVYSFERYKGTAITNAFQKVLDESIRKLNKAWVDKGSKFNNGSMKPWLEKNAAEMYSTYNEWKSVVAERFIRTLKKKIYKHMTSISKNVNKIDDKANKYNNTYHSTIKMKPGDIKPSKYIDFDKNNDKEGPKFKVGDNFRISK